MREFEGGCHSRAEQRPGAERARSLPHAAGHNGLRHFTEVEIGAEPQVADVAAVPVNVYVPACAPVPAIKPEESQRCSELHFSRIETCANGY